MPGRGETDRPFMGSDDLVRDDPHLEARIEAYKHLARALGSTVVVADYPDPQMPVRVFVGTNHPYQQQVSTETI